MKPAWVLLGALGAAACTPPPGDLPTATSSAPDAGPSFTEEGPVPAPFRALADRREVRDLVLFEGEVWAASTGGVDRYRRSGEHLASYSTADGLAGNGSEDLTVVDGELRVAGSHGLSVWTGQGFEVVEGPEGAKLPHRLSADRVSRRLATATLDAGRQRWEGTFDGWVHVDGPARHRVLSVGGRVLGLLEDPAGWPEGIFAITDLGVVQLAPLFEARAVFEGDLTAWASNNDGALLVATAVGEVLELQGPKKARRLRERQERPVTALLADGDRLWLGEAGRGVVVVERGHEKAVGSKPEVCANHIAALTHHDGKLVLGTFDQGVCFLEASGPRALKSPKLPSDLMLSLGSVQDTLWLGTGFGVVRVSRESRLEAFAPSFKNRFALSAYGIVAVGHDDTHLWIADGRGVSRVGLGQGGQGEHSDVTRFRNLPGLPEGNTDLVVAGSHVWVGTEAWGVSHWDGESWQRMDTADGLAEQWVVKLAAADDGRVWAGHSMRGLSFYDGVAWRRIGVEDGLPDGSVTALFFDRSRELVFVGTLGGLAIVDGVTGEVRDVFGAAEGLPDVRVHAIHVEEDTLWVGTEGGLAKARIPDQSSHTVWFSGSVR